MTERVKNKKEAGKEALFGRWVLAEKVNFIVKAKSVKARDVKKALEEAGIEVRSVIEVFREKEEKEEEMTLDRD